MFRVNTLGADGPTDWWGVRDFVNMKALLPLATCPGGIEIKGIRGLPRCGKASVLWASWRRSRTWRSLHCGTRRDRSDANAAGWNRRREGPPHGDQRPDRHLRGALPQGRQYAARLDRIESQIRTAVGPKVEEIQHQFEALRREALLANPLLSGQPLLFVVRAQYAPDHHNTETMFQTGEINTGSFHGGGALRQCSQIRRAGQPSGRRSPTQP